MGVFVSADPVAVDQSPSPDHVVRSSYSPEVPEGSGNLFRSEVFTDIALFVCPIIHDLRLSWSQKTNGSSIHCPQWLLTLLIDR